MDDNQKIQVVIFFFFCLQGLLLSVICANQFAISVAQDRSPGINGLSFPGPAFVQNLQNQIQDFPFPIPPLPRRRLLRPPYTLFINAGNFRREEVSDENGNVNGVYSYKFRNDKRDASTDTPRIKPFPDSPLSFPMSDVMPEIPFLPIPKFPPFSIRPQFPIFNTTENPQDNKTEETADHTVLAENVVPTTTDKENFLTVNPEN